MTKEQFVVASEHSIEIAADIRAAIWEEHVRTKDEVIECAERVIAQVLFGFFQAAAEDK